MGCRNVEQTVAYFHHTESHFLNPNALISLDTPRLTGSASRNCLVTVGWAWGFGSFGVMGCRNEQWNQHSVGRYKVGNTNLAGVKEKSAYITQVAHGSFIYIKMFCGQNEK